MTELVFKNQELSTIIPARDLSSITSGLIAGTTAIPDSDINALNNEAVFYYAANKLLITLDSGLPLGWSFSGPEVRVNGFWKKTETSSDGTEFSKYERFETDADVVVFTSGRITLKINASDEQQVNERFDALRVPKPDFGLLVVVLSFRPFGVFTSAIERAYCIKYSHIPLFSAIAVDQPDPALNSRENSYRGPPLSFESLFVPSISSSFHYNFYESEEEDYEVYRVRNYDGVSLDQIPKYIKLKWNHPVFDLNQWTVENSAIPGLVAAPNGPTVAPSSSFTTTPAGTGPLVAAPIGVSISSDAFVAAPRGIAINPDELAHVMSDPDGRTGASASRVFDGATEISEGAPVEGSIDPFAVNAPRPTFTIGTYSDYIGYIIEKSTVEEDGTIRVIDLIPIPGKNSLEFIDWKVAYNAVYKYRVRSIFRYIDTRNISLFEDSDLSISKTETIRYIDQNFIGDINKTYYYDGVFSQPSEVQTTESVRPDPPDNLRIFSKSRDKYILLCWSQKNQNRDVVGFNVYRKNINEKIFQKLNIEPLSIRNNLYKDYDIEPDVEYVYAIEAVDFHGNFSTLSAQYSIKTQEIFSDEFVCDSKQKFYNYEGKELNDLPIKEEIDLLVCKNRLTININPLFFNSLDESNFVIKITSLDMGTSKQIKLNFKNLSIYHASPYVPAETSPFILFVPFNPAESGLFDF